MPMPTRRFSRLGAVFRSRATPVVGGLPLHFVTPRTLADAHVEWGQLVKGLRAIASGDEPRVASQAQRLLAVWGPGQHDAPAPEPAPPLVRAHALK